VLSALSKGSITDAQLIEETLLVRLKKNNANIKWKSLKVIKHLATNGNPSIARNFQKNHEAIRDCVSKFFETFAKVIFDVLNRFYWDAASVVWR
jgi:hypothetical protein